MNAKDFPAFFEAIHGHNPFPWQTRLLETVLKDDWPGTLSLPTASGKTAVLDVAVFALVCQALLPPATRRAPRRMALVVDRRVVVDESFARACKIRDALVKAQDGILREAADALRHLGGETPLDVALLRGGIYREDRWARTPCQPVILCSTVDQVGSRLLHRGYGISSKMSPIHAGLLGNDALIVLDEAHTSRPFLQTLEWVKKYRAVGSEPLALPFKVVAMTATPRTTQAPFCLADDDYANLVLRRRIDAKKQTGLGESGDKDGEFANACVELLRGSERKAGLARPGTTTLVVVNRVAAARAIRQKLAELQNARRGADKMDADSILLTGRSRPFERDKLIKKWRDRLMAGRDRKAVSGCKPLIVVATQCVEVGADFDVDALITECCAFDAMRQRLGRLDRLGELGESQAVVLIRDGQKEGSDPIYGAALANTWKWLSEKKGDADRIDLGIASLEGTPDAQGFLPKDAAQRAELLEPMNAPKVDAPVIFPAYCDLWAQTGPEPAVSPEPAIFLHGPRSGEPEVRLVWRADLEPDKSDIWADIVSFCPPVSSEALPLPIGMARKWLANKLEKTDDATDLESAPAAFHKKDDNEQENRFKVALRWRGPENSDLAKKPEDIRPGDTLILPAVYGRCDSEGWNPESMSPVVDLADICRVAARRPAVLRLHSSLPLPESLKPLADAVYAEMPDDLRAQVMDALEMVKGDAPSAQLAELLRQAKKRLRIQPHPSGRGLVLSCDLRPSGSLEDFTDEDDTSAHAGGKVALFDHLAEVEHKTRAIALSAGLSRKLTEDIALAASLHDLGKADNRFQTLLAGGNPFLARRQGLLAKSSHMPENGASIEMARKRAGYPQGGRHELLSLRLAEAMPDRLGKAHDRNLVLHLVASHHGHCRPFAPVVFDDRPLTVSVEMNETKAEASSATGLERLDSGVADRFWELVRKYGWWGLAYLEACLRLADHRASENPTTLTEEA